MSGVKAFLVDRSKITVFALLIFCFAIWGLINCMTDNLVPAFQRIFTMDQSRAGLVQVAYYGAYAVLSIFAAVLAEELSYRKGLLVGLGIYIVGALLYIPACVMQSFDIYFIGIFIVASGCSLLETTCNPYVLSLGAPETAVRRLNFAQMFNPIGSLAGIALAQQFILSHLNPATAEMRAAMEPAAREAVIHDELFWVCAPYVGLCLLAFLVWLFFLFVRSEGAGGAASRRTGLKRIGMCLLFSAAPMILLRVCFPSMNEVAWILASVLGPVAYLLTQGNYRGILLGLVRTPRYSFGVVAQFFYVGVQTAVWTLTNVYCQRELGVSPADGAIYYIFSMILFVACRWIATFMMKYFNPARLMALFAAGAMVACLGVMYVPSQMLFAISICGRELPMTGNVICYMMMSGFMSLMFPTIYGMALEGLDGKQVKIGSSGLIMAILGGAIITIWMTDIIGNTSSVWCNLIPASFGTEWNVDLRLTQTTLRASFVVPLICFASVLAYALCFGGRRRKGGMRC